MTDGDEKIRHYRCTFCSKSGHNIRTCPKRPPLIDGKCPPGFLCVHEVRCR